MGETLTYEVNDIQVVLPQVVDATRIQNGKDLVSLITCTPYGVNTHRLVVQGTRIETPAEEEIQAIIEQAENEEDSTSVWTQNYWSSVKTGIFISFFILILILFAYICIRLKGKRK